MKITLLAAVSALAISTVAASAADVSVAAPVADWSGFYAGVGGGASFVFSDLNFEENITKDQKTTSFDPVKGENGAQGGFGTIELGYDYQVNDQFVIGIAGNFDFGSDMGNSVKNSSASGKKVYEADWSASNTWGVGVRAGYLASESTLLFVDGGYTQADIEASASYSKEGDVLYNAKNDAWSNGYYIGGGVQTMLTDSIYVKAEYRFASYQDLNGQDSCSGCSGDRVGKVTTGNVDVQTVRGTLGWRF